MDMAKSTNSRGSDEFYHILIQINESSSNLATLLEEYRKTTTNGSQDGAAEVWLLEEAVMANESLNVQGFKSFLPRSYSEVAEEMVNWLTHDSSDGQLSLICLFNSWKGAMLCLMDECHESLNSCFDLMVHIRALSQNLEVADITRVVLQSITHVTCDLTDLDRLQQELTDRLSGKKFLFVLSVDWGYGIENWEKLCGPFRAGAPGSTILLAIDEPGIVPGPKKSVKAMMASSVTAAISRHKKSVKPMMKSWVTAAMSRHKKSVKAASSIIPSPKALTASKKKINTGEFLAKPSLSISRHVKLGGRVKSLSSEAGSRLPEKGLLESPSIPLDHSILSETFSLPVFSERPSSPALNSLNLPLCLPELPVLARRPKPFPVSSWPTFRYLQYISSTDCTEFVLLGLICKSKHLVFLETISLSQTPIKKQLESLFTLPNSGSLILTSGDSLQKLPEDTELSASTTKGARLHHFETTELNSSQFMMHKEHKCATVCFEIDDFSCLAPFFRSNWTATAECLKIRVESPRYILEWMVPDKRASLKYLESYHCSFSDSSPRGKSPKTHKKLKIVNWENSESLLKKVMGKENVFLKNLEIYGCSTVASFPTSSKIPITTPRQLKITNSTSLQLLPEGLINRNPSLERLHIEGFHSLISFRRGDTSPPQSPSNTNLKLTELEIWDCLKLEFLPQGLHQLSFLNKLSISNCPRLVSFPEGGLPSNLNSLLIFECENLRCLPDKMHNLTSLHVLSISSCPSLLYFPEGGLPTNLVSLSIIDCENLRPVFQWELHKLINLRKFTLIGGCSHLDLQ